MKRIVLCLLGTAVANGSSLSQTPADNSNLWPIHRDVTSGFRLSYPPGWVIVPPKGPNVRFSVNPKDGPGNCNVVARQNSQLAGMTQAALNREIQTLPNDAASWADYAGVPVSQVVLIDSRRGRIPVVPVTLPAAGLDVPALISTMETSLENLEGKFTRKQMIALAFTPRFMWSLNCGASSFKADEARARFAQLRATFGKVFGSFALLK